MYDCRRGSNPAGSVTFVLRLAAVVWIGEFGTSGAWNAGFAAAISLLALGAVTEATCGVRAGFVAAAIGDVEGCSAGRVTMSAATATAAAIAPPEPQRSHGVRAATGALSASSCAMTLLAKSTRIATISC